MFSIAGYNFCSDGNSLDAAPSAVDNINDITIRNGVFENFNMTADVISPYSPDIPTTWQVLTLINANFNGTLNGGNVDFVMNELSGFKIKRRKLSDFNWVALGFMPIEDTTKLQFVFNDNLAASLEEYEYAFVPILGNVEDGVEGNYMTNTIGTNFKGVYICDQETIYRFYAGVSYGAQEQVQKMGVLEPLGRRYPVFVSNALTNYAKGNVTGTVLPNDYAETRQIDKVAITKQREALVQFLTDGKPKILKDWNGASYLLFVTGNPQTTYLNNSGMTLANVGFDWTEAGDSNSQEDLVETGMIAGDF